MKTGHQSKAIAIAAVILITFAALLVSLRPALAQSQDPNQPKSEVQLLKEKMQLLEQTVEGLKTQLKAIEDAKKASSATATGEKVGVTATTSTSPTDVGTTPAIPGAKPDNPPGESTFEIYGFAMLDMGYQFKQADPNWFDTVRPVKLPAFRDEFAPSGNFFSSVRQSRLGVKSSTPTKYGELKTIFEFELFGTGAQAGQTIFRLRHAYGELGKVGAGQYWSMFVDPDVFPSTNEYWGPNGIAWYRNVQFRWMPIKGRNSVTLGVERPGASADLGQVGDRIELQGVKARFPVPDLTGNVRFTRDWGHVQIGGVLRYIKWEDNVADAFDLSGSAVGAGIGITSVLNFNKTNTGKFSFVYGHGIQNYMNDAPVDVGIELTHSTNPRVPIRGVALPVTAFMVYLDHRWGERWTSSIGYSMLDISNSDGQLPSAFSRGHYGSGNILFYPVPNVMIGSEIIWGRRENFLDGFSSEDVHLQFSFKYNFSKQFKF